MAAIVSSSVEGVLFEELRAGSLITFLETDFRSLSLFLDRDNLYSL